MGIIINDNEFTLDEIIYMLDLTNKIPLSKEDISLENIQSKIPNESIARNIHDFLTDEYEVDTEKVYFKVVELDDSDATNTMRNSYLPNLGDGKQRIIDENTFTFAKNERTVQEHYTVPFRQGKTNPTYINTIEQILTIDSENRRILPSTKCINIVLNDGKTIKVLEDDYDSNVKFIDTSTDYTMWLNEPIKDVIEITLTDVNVPIYSYQKYSSDYGTNSFWISYDTGEKDASNNVIYTDASLCQIPNGNYTNDELINQLNGLPTSHDISFSIINNKTVIVNRDISDVKIEWYKFQDVAECGKEVVSNGAKINYNLGKLLGFTNYIIYVGHDSPNQITSPTNLYNCADYVYVTIDDFNNNKPTPIVISTNDKRDRNFSLSSKFITSTMNKDIISCSNYDQIVKGDPQKNNRRCSNTTLNYAHVNVLTNAEKQSSQSNSIGRRSNDADRYSVANINDYMAKIPFTNNDLINRNDLVYTANSIQNTKRTYFGPITLRKLRVQLLNKYGLPVNLNGSDWDLTLKIKRIYQY